jgi:hypothetical protein
MSRIITDDKLNMIDDVEPTQVLMAVHKRLVAAEKGFMNLRGVVSDLSIEIEMLKDKIDKLEERNKEEDELLGAPYNSVYGEDEQEESK